MDTLAAFQQLYRLCDENRPPAPELYVRSKRSVVASLVGEIRFAPDLNSKHLLYGSTGCGKSTQLRAIASELAGSMTLVDVDFDASGISVPGISAFDLAYVIGVKALKHVALDDAKPLFAALAEAYAEGDEGDASALGRLDEALPGIAGFGDAVLAVAKEAGAAMLPGVAAVSAVKGAMHALRLRSTRAGVVVETSPRGRRLQSALEDIFTSVRAAHGGRSIAVLVDGLEKVNGGANRWMRETFDYTRLLTDLPVTMVAATPVCTLTQTNSNLAAGWTPHVVYGFAPDDLGTLSQVMFRRVRSVGLDLDAHGFAAAGPRLVEASGGHPRHAMLLLKFAVLSAATSGRDVIAPEDVDVTIRRLREQLSVAVLKNGKDVLRAVDATHELPSDDLATTLFGDGRILVHPPGDDGRNTFHVHPLLLASVRKAEGVAPPSSDDA